ncbi:MAG TPA: hypothetical protein VEA16_04530 [Vicinamibacterales bacterium]|nr:hypothetical protein [Vicinamibacterales bacterium]
MRTILAAALLLVSAPGASIDVTDRQMQVVSLSDTKPLSIEITIGNVRIEGWDKAEAEIVVERRAPTPAQLARVPLAIDDTPARVIVRALQTENTTEPTLRADVTVRVPRTARIERVQVLEGKIAVEGFAGTLTADIRRGPIEGKALSGTLRLEAGIGSVILTNTRLSPNGLLRLRAFNGDVRLTLAERPQDARIMALALNGHVRSDIPLTHRNTWGPRWAETTLGKGEPVISIDVVTGMVEIKSP